MLEGISRGSYQEVNISDAPNVVLKPVTVSEALVGVDREEVLGYPLSHISLCLSTHGSKGKMRQL